MPDVIVFYKIIQNSIASGGITVGQTDDWKMTSDSREDENIPIYARGRWILQTQKFNWHWRNDKNINRPTTANLLKLPRMSYDKKLPVWYSNFRNTWKLKCSEIKHSWTDRQLRKEEKPERRQEQRLIYMSEVVEFHKRLENLIASGRMTEQQSDVYKLKRNLKVDKNRDFYTCQRQLHFPNYWKIQLPLTNWQMKSSTTTKWRETR